MKAVDLLQFSGRALRASRVRTALTLVAMAIGVASVVVLTALGEGARTYVVDEFSSLGTHLLIVLPGRSETTGGPPPLLGETPRDLTLSDALALTRSSAVQAVAPVTVGSAPVSWRQREREVTILGSTSELYGIRDLVLGQGRFLPAGDPRRERPVCVLGHTVKQELFGGGSALGRWIRVNDRRFRVVGVLAPKGQSLGVDIGDAVIVPVASAQALFNETSLFRVLVQARSSEAIPGAKAAILEIIRMRHDGEDDVTVITQDAVTATFNRIFDALTLTVAGIAAISLSVAGILIMNVLLVSVSQRTAEIGLLKALGATPVQIVQLFLTESVLMSLAGGLMGLAVALASAWALGRLFILFTLVIPPWSVVAALLVSLVTGLGFGVMPARRAARLDPVAALARR